MKPQRARLHLLGLALACGGAAWGRQRGATPGRSGAYWDRSEVRDFASVTIQRFGLPADAVEGSIRSGRRCEAAVRWMSSGAVAQPDWRRFRAGQIEEHKLARGLSFWWKYQESLQRAQAQFGTTPEFVVAIIGIESHYGRVTGRFRILDVLLTLAFDLARRGAEYQEELAQFLAMSHEQGADPGSYLGSIAGAIGMPQFLPSSIRKYALDFDGDGRIDLSRSARDAIGSVAHFLSEHGWRAELPALLPVPPRAGEPEAATAGSEGPTTWGRLLELGAAPQPRIEATEPVRLIGLHYLDGAGNRREEQRAVTANFEALLSYNRSEFYAATVGDLAQELRSRFEADTAYSASG